jgi:hypothetical protein
MELLPRELASPTNGFLKLGALVAGFAAAAGIAVAAG